MASQSLFVEEGGVRIYFCERQSSVCVKSSNTSVTCKIMLSMLPRYGPPAVLIVPALIDSNLNAIRLEGKFEREEFFALADEYGIMTMPGWCCCDAWQRWSLWTNDIAHVAYESLRSQVKRLRIHPSVIVFLYGSDQLAPPNIERYHPHILTHSHTHTLSLSKKFSQILTL